MPTKWDDKAERDLLLAMRMAEGTNTISKETWEKATELMKAMGHTDATWTGISQRWSKVILKNFHENPSQATTNGGNGAAAAASSAPAPAPAATRGRPRGRGGNGRGNGRKRRMQEEVQGEDNNEDGVQHAPDAKKQKN